ncbi:MAG TPA: Hsp70 family protein [Streptosporangiaceae bacterium]|nr:Hsp70 family protein [Streptosporangiaceae bacterium]
MASAVPPWRLSIDFGTTSTAAAVSAGDSPGMLLQLEQDSNRMPSAVFLEEDGQLAAGRRAVNQAMQDPARFLPAPKREIGHRSVSLGPARLSPAQLIAAVLLRVLAEAFRQRGARPPEALVLTRPAGWGPARTEVLTSALSQAAASLPAHLIAAGLPEAVAAAAGSLPAPLLVPEPVAAAWHYAQNYQLADDAALAIYDLGGGTFDTAVVARRADAGFAVMAHDGLADLGGEDFDAALFQLAGTRLAASHPDRWQAILNPGGDHDAWTDRRRLLDNVQAAKEDLSTKTKVSCRLLNHPLAETLIRRKELDEIIEPDLTRSMNKLAAILSRAAPAAAQLAGTYLVGGSSRIVLVATLMRNQLGIEPATLDDPKSVVALGGLIAAAHQPAPTPPGVPHAGAARPAASTSPARTPGTSQTPAPAPIELHAELQQEIPLPAKSHLYDIKVNPGLTRLIAPTSDRSLSVIDLPSGRTRSIRPRRFSDERISRFALSGDGHSVATSSARFVRIYDATTGKNPSGVLKTVFEPFEPNLALHSGSRKPASLNVIRMTFSHDSRLLLVHCQGLLYLRQAAATDKRLRLHDCGGIGYRGIFSPDDRWLFTNDDYGMTVWEVATERQVLRRLGAAAAFSRDSRQIAVASRNDHNVEVWDLGSGEKAQDFAFTGRVDAVAFGNDGMIAVRIAPWPKQPQTEPEIHVLDVASGAELSLIPDRGAYTGIEFAHSGRWVQGRGRDIWDVRSGQRLLDMDRLGRFIAFDAETRRCLTASSSAVQLWRIVQEPVR